MNERTRLERNLMDGNPDFSAAYVLLGELLSSIQKAPNQVTDLTLVALEHALRNPSHRRQKQSLFLYKLAAEGLAAMASLNGVPDSLASGAVEALKQVSCTGGHSPQRAAAEALGGLPLSINGPHLQDTKVEPATTLTWEEIQVRSGFQPHPPVLVYGRSFAVRACKNDELLVIKLTGKENSPANLQLEAIWMDYLASGPRPPVPFRVPRPLWVGNGYLFRLPCLPEGLNSVLSQRVHHEHLAIAYRVQPDYFSYINSHKQETGLDAPAFAKALGDCACLLAHLTSRGIVHQAPIPLFHNRVQTQRRADGGLYQWPRGGRLDRWLHSCQYPNLGLTGIRDFEHFTSFRGPTTQLYQHIGTHLLSLILVAGSYFRNQNPNTLGKNPDGTPVDARHLFPQAFFRELLQIILQQYYLGFVGHPLSMAFVKALDLDLLSRRLVEELGVDRYMEEVIRLVDQQQMSDDEFSKFLIDRGIPKEEALAKVRAREDIILLTGPHLGRFNDRISVPELIQFTSAASALCVADRFLRDRYTCSQKAAVEHGNPIPVM